MAREMTHSSIDMVLEQDEATPVAFCWAADRLQKAQNFLSIEMP
jgi:hypothetical protein